MGRKKKLQKEDKEFLDFVEENPYPQKFLGEQKFNIKVKPITENQKIFMNLLNEKQIIIALGPAGVGKSYLACAHASKMLVKNKFDKIILTRTSIPTGKSLGYFPGDITEKLTPWLCQYIHYLKTFLGNNTVEIWMKDRSSFPPKIILQPMETIRGMNWDNTIVIVEECQNLSWDEILMLSTRISENSLLIFSGDLYQRDIAISGVERLLDLSYKYGIQGIGEVQFTSEDIVRSTIVKDIIQAVETEGL